MVIGTMAKDACASPSPACILGLVTMAAMAAVGTFPLPAAAQTAHPSDRDCSDFDSQASAQD